MDGTLVLPSGRSQSGDSAPSTDNHTESVLAGASKEPVLLTTTSTARLDPATPVPGALTSDTMRFAVGAE